MASWSPLSCLLTFAAVASAARVNSDSKLGTDAETSIHLSGNARISTEIGTSDCDLSFYPDLKGRFEDQRYAGQGANGCVVLAKDKKNGGVEVAVKLAKRGTMKKKTWEDECARSRLLHKKACAAGDEQLLLAERYLPICLEVGGKDGAPFIVMHAAGGKGIGEKRSKLRGVDRVSVFAQIVGALTAMHGVGLSHNDLHNQNVVILARSESPQVVFIDFGEVVPLSQAKYTGGYKQDENIIAREAAELADCKNAKYPFHAETIDVTKRDERKQALEQCLKEKWGKGEDEQSCGKFLRALGEVINEAYSHQHHRKTVTSTKVVALYKTSFVQQHQPTLESLFPANLCGSVGEGEIPDRHKVNHHRRQEAAGCGQQHGSQHRRL